MFVPSIYTKAQARFFFCLLFFCGHTQNISSIEVESQKFMSNGYFLDRLEAETFTEFHGNGGCLVEARFDSVDHVKGKQKSLFSQFFWVYLKENCSNGNVRHVLVIFGDGQLLDLYQLFSLVKEITRVFFIN